MPDVVSPFVGIALGIPGLTALALQLINGWKAFFRRMKTAERDGELLFTRFDHLTQRYMAVQAVLFQEGKFDFVRGTVFSHFSSDQQNILHDMFFELVRLLYHFYRLYQTRNIDLVKAPPGNDSFDITLSPERVAALFAETEIVPRHGESRSRLSWTTFAWAASNKKHVEKLIEHYEDWLNRIRETMEDFWWPQSFSEKFANLQAMESDKDFEATGMTVHSCLRKLLLDDSPFKPTLELKSVPHLLYELKDTSSELRKIGILDGRQVLVEIMPYEVDSNGFMPIELRRRFCRIAALLNAQEITRINVLRCLCWRQVHEYDGFVLNSSFQLISALPTASPEHFQTLSEMIRLLRGNQKPSFDCRLGICREVAQTLSECFKIGWRHRNVRSSNVLFFFRENDIHTQVNEVLRKPILCGFEESRLRDDYSMQKHGDDSLESNVYRHPDRCGTPKGTFSIYHDLYAFGVLLLEIGLWEPILHVLKRHIGSKTTSSLTPQEVKAGLVKANKGEAIHKTGNRYARMIEMCLTSNFGVDNDADSALQTQVQLVFRRELLEGLGDMQEVLGKP